MTENDQQILIEPENTLPEFTFDTLPDVMREAIAGLGWKTPMPVQAKATPYLLDKRDMIVQSRTGSGKTGAFLIPLILRIDPSRRHPQALILVPTRELAGQVFKEFEILSEGMGLRGVLVYGGVGYNTQLQALRDGAQVVIGTPGRVLDHIGRRSLVLDRLTTMIFDEADEMLSMGFYPDMLEIRRYLPRERASWMFSATMPYRVQMLAREFLRDPEFLSLSAGSVSVSTAEHRYYDVPPLEKDLMLMRLIEMENPDSAIVFCNTKQDVEYLATVLLNYGYNADQLSGDLDQKSREAAMARIRNGETRFLVATDVAARGIDISDLSHVIQYDVPKDPDSYIHRAGRTARAGNTGVVITLIANMAEKSDLKKIARRYEVDFVEMPMPTQEEMESRLAERLIVALDDRIRSGFTKLQRERMKRFISLVRTLAESDDEALLLAMLLDDVYYNTYNLGRTAAPKPGSTLTAKQEQRSSKKKGDDSRSKDRSVAEPSPTPPADRNDRGNDKRDSDKPRSSEADRKVDEARPDVEEMEGAEGMPGTEGEATKKKKKRRRKRNRRRDGEPMSDEERNDQESGSDVDDLEDEGADDDIVNQDAPPITTKADVSMKAKEERGDTGRRNDDRRREERPREERPREDRRGTDEVRSNDRRNDEPRKDDRRKEEPRGNDRRNDEPRKDDRRKEEPRSDDRRNDEPRKEEPRGDDRRREEPRKDDRRREEPRGDDRRRDEPRKDDRRKEEPRSDDRRNDEPRKDDRRKEEPRSDDRRRDEPRREEPRKDDRRKEEPRGDDRRRDEPRREEPRREEPRRDDRRKEERPREERRSDDRRGQEKKDRPQAQPAAGSVRRMEVGTGGIDVIEVFEPDAPAVVEPTPIVKREEKPGVAKSEPKKSEPRVVTPKAEAPKAEAPKAEAPKAESQSIEPPAELEFDEPKATKEVKVGAKPKKAPAAKRPPSPKSKSAANENEPAAEITPPKPTKAKKAPAAKAPATKASAAKAPAARKGRSKEE
jgi:ATP-dependent RNA helicase DeaD